MSHSSRHPRRKMLQLGLAGMALPPLASLLGAPNVARAATTDKKPTRLVTIFFPNGVSLPPEGHSSFKNWHWFPHHPGSDYVLTNTLQPLAKLRSDISILSGFSHPHLRLQYHAFLQRAVPDR